MIGRAIREGSSAEARRAVFFLVRFAFASFCAASAAYCLLAYAPFSNRALIQGDFGSWLPLFAILQPWLFVVLSAAVVAATLPKYGYGRSKGWSMTAAVSLGGFAIWMVVTQPLAGATMDATTLARASLMFVPLGFVGFFDVLDASRRIIWSSSKGAESARQFLAVAGAAVAVGLVFFSIGVAVTPEGAIRLGELLTLGVTSLWAQFVIAACVYIGLALARAAASFSYRSAFWEAVLIVAGGALVVAWALVLIVLKPLAIEGFDAWATAIAAATSLGLLVYGTAIRHRAYFAAPEIGSGVDLVVAGFGLPPRVRPRVVAAVLFGAMAAFWVAAHQLVAIDWELVMSRLLVIAAWIAFVSILYRLIPPREPAPDATIVWIEICVLVLGGLYVVDRWGARIPEIAGGGNLERAAMQWRSRDAAFRLAGDMSSLTRRYPDGKFYAFLRGGTTVARGRTLEPLELQPVDRISEIGTDRPNIIVAVVDGLRPAPSGTADRTASLTPEIDLVATEGVAFRNAFTRYGASGLAEPSIWFGGMTLHEAYVEPFHSMNALQSLLEAGRYRLFFADSAILRSVVRDGPLITRVHETGNEDFGCSQIAELQAAIDPVAGSAEPIFAYVRLSGARGPGFESGATGRAADGTSASPRVARRLRDVDACLGGFFDFLRAKGIWDTSIVIVTADRGDPSSARGALDGHHALTPEALRVPLVVKLPRERRNVLRSDPDAIAFTNDITPTLYYLLGQRPIRNSDFLGRPLFTTELREQAPYIRGDYLVASGYGPVYGILAENGRRLYVADAINFRDTVYEVPTEGVATSRDPKTGESRRAHALLREKIEAIARAYGIAP